MTKNQSKSRNPTPDGDEQYYHPILETQMIIRFPADIAARLNQAMEDEEEGFKDFKICFTDKKHANVKLFGEELKAVLVSLPTIVETHRTVDGSHLFKSADIGEILIVHRANAPPDGISEDFVFDHGLTPPTLNIVKKRLAKQEAARANQSENSSIDGIQYWEMVEIQLAALLSKEKTAKPVCRQEFMEEPDVDPVTLEKILRRNGKSEFKGYSGTNIDDSEIEDFTLGDDPVVHIPDEIVDEIIPPSNETNESENEELGPKEGELEHGIFKDISNTDAEDTAETTAATSSASEDESGGDTSSSSGNENEEEEEEEEETDETESKIKELKTDIDKLNTNLERYKKYLKEDAGNETMVNKLTKRIDQTQSHITSKKQELEKLLASRAQTK
ncbi:transcription initiation factor TFIID subunit 7 [Tritrichomonas musculus]|uniref:Transcription initiation factor TFIID subunit 7 n=1 Tax=Tritrichomonas musculus TaxID=1915356 RepID=A0ABR2HVQ6_9EUKA